MFPLCSEKSDWREGPKREPNLVGDRYTTVMSVTRPLHLGDGRSVPWRRRPGDNWIGVGRKFSLHPLADRRNCWRGGLGTDNTAIRGDAPSRQATSVAGL